MPLPSDPARLPVFAFVLFAVSQLSQAAGPPDCGEYGDPSGPFYSEHRSDGGSPEAVLQAVSYNTKFSQDVPGVIQAFQTDPRLQQSDFIFLQELNGKPDGSWNAASEIALALGMNYVYSPAELRCNTRLDFGNAILSRWPLSDFRRVLLPHKQPLNGSRRIALAATAHVAGRPVRVYTLHLETVFWDSFIPTEPSRKDQADAVLTSIREDGMNDVLVGGDFNDLKPLSFIGPRKHFEKDGFVYGTPGRLWTFSVLGGLAHFKIDHFFARGLRRVDSGTVKTVQTSDHIPVWMEFQLP